MASAEARKVAVITGASSGIGAETAVTLAKAGYNLSITGRDEAALETVKKECEAACKDHKIEVVITVGDITKEEVAKKIVDNTIAEFDRLDALVNAAGILVGGGAAKLPISDYDKQFDVNVRSMIIITQACIPHLIKTQGSIVNVSSIAGICSFAGATYYCMSKAAVDMFTKCLALELAPKQVRVNAVNPGVIRTNVHKRAGMNEEEYKQFLEHSKTTHALGRVGEVDEVAKAIAFLAGADSSFTTGVLLPVDGGRGIMTPR
uniref:Uncharacterized protein n=1 Tax=Plectus sambesii TaxID=2011161 RepID=A0A914VYB2_9BILA